MKKLINISNLKLNILGLLVVAFLLTLGSCAKEELESFDTIEIFEQDTRAHENLSAIGDLDSNRDPFDKVDELITDDEEDDEDEDEANDR